LGGALLSLLRPSLRKRSCVLFHIKCPECGSRIVKTGTPTAADANAEFDKAIAAIKLLGATPDTEPSSSKEQAELFCLFVGGCRPLNLRVRGLDYPLTDPCQFDILLFGPGWWGSNAIRSV
jgi:DNA-directed RNA polymerase subunit RPC12/RpoP